MSVFTYKQGMKKKTPPKKQTSVSELRRLTPKQNMFVQAYANSLNGTDAAMAAYDTKKRSVAQVIASENLRKPITQDAVKAALRRVGYTEEFISDRLKAITEAGTSERALKQASVRDANKSLELGARLYGLLGNNNTNVTLNLKAELSAKTPNELKDEILKLRDEEARFLK